MPHFAHPYFTPNDRLQLHPTLVYEEGSLHDQPLGARHRLHPGSHTTVSLLGRGCTYSALARHATRHGLGSAQLAALLGFISNIGGLCVQRSAISYGQWLSTILTHRLLGITYPSTTRRYRPGPIQLFRAIIRASWIVGVAGVVSGSLVVAAGICSPMEALLIGGWMTGLFVSSVAIHEYSHCLALSPLSAIVLQRGMRLGIVHRQLSPGTERSSALAGPVAGASICLVAASLSLAAGTTLLAATGYLLALFHGCSLLPWYADGAVIWKGRATHA